MLLVKNEDQNRRINFPYRDTLKFQIIHVETLVSNFQLQLEWAHAHTNDKHYNTKIYYKL